MLNEHELQALLDRLNIPLAARDIVYAIRAAPPSRRVKATPKSVPGQICNPKMGVTNQSESRTNEFGALLEWKFDSKCHECYDQPEPVKISYRAANGRTVTIWKTFDFFLIAEDFVGWVECKTEDWLQRECKKQPEVFSTDGDGVWHYKPGDDYAANVGLHFHLRSSSENNWTLLRNLEFLEAYFDGRCPIPTAEEVAKVRHTFKECAWCPLIDLVRADTDISSDVIYTLIAKKQLYVDLENDPLSRLEFTMVFRDEAAARAYGLSFDAQGNAQAPMVSPIRLAIGTKISWADQPYEIVNVAQELMFLQDPNRRLIQLPRGEFERLVITGAVTGLPEVEYVAKRQKLVDRLKSATIDAQEDALTRRQWLEGCGPATSAPPNGSTLRRWRKKCRLAKQEYGNSFPGLLHDKHKRGNRNRKLPERVIEAMDEIIKAHYEGPDQKSFTLCFGLLRLRCEEQGLASPSKDAYRYQIKTYKAHKLKESRQGARAAYDLEAFLPEDMGGYSRHGDRPFEIAHIDHTIVDLQLVDKRYYSETGKAWLTVLLDAYTRTVLAWYITFDSPSYRSCMMVIRRCVERWGRVPEAIIADGGAEFKSTYFQSTLASLTCDVFYRAASKPRFGAVIERFFGIAMAQLIHNLVGNNKPLQKPRTMSATHDPRNRAIWTLAALRLVFAEWLADVYEKRVHPALSVSPSQAMQIGLQDFGMREHQYIPYDEAFLMQTRPTTDKGTVKVQAPGWVKVNSFSYACLELKDHRQFGKNLPVKYEPFDMSLAFIFVDGYWRECRSKHAKLWQGLSERDIEQISAELKAQLEREGRNPRFNEDLLAWFYSHKVLAFEAELAVQKRAGTSSALPTSDEKTGVTTAANQEDVGASPEPDLKDYRKPREKRFFGDF